MKTQLTSRRNKGSVLLLCLGAMIIISVGLSTILYMVMSANNQAVRSQAWNNALTLAEGGIEEGMALVNKNVTTANSVRTWYNTAQSDDGWIQVAPNVFTLPNSNKRTLANGYYSIWVTNNGTSVTIKATGTTLLTNNSVTPITRAILINAGLSSPYQGAIASKGLITMSGSSFVDSFNSAIPAYSSNGVYDVSKRLAGGNILAGLSNSVLTKTLAMSGSARIYGKVSTGPNDYISNGGLLIGDTNWAGPGAQPGWTNNNVNISIDDAPPIPTPPIAWLPIPPMTNKVVILDGGGPGHTNYYKADSTSPVQNLSGGQTMLLTNGTVVFLVDNINFKVSSSTIAVAPNSSMVAWWDYPSMTISGGGVVNGTQNATNVTIYGTSQLTAITYSGGSGFIGTMYTPYANVTLSGGSAVSGAFVANSFNNSGGSPIHFDENLLGNYFGAYVLNSWAEITP